jgi:hypothetical protein
MGMETREMEEVIQWVRLGNYLLVHRGNVPKKLCWKLNGLF